MLLIIIPHIDQYKALYSDKQNVEIDAKNNIKISIPQAFSEKLASVIIWNYRKKAYEPIPELTAQWVDATKPLSEIFNSNLPFSSAGEFMINHDNKYKTFKLEKLVEWLTANNIDKTTLQKLVDLNVKAAIRQQSSVKQKDDWNLCIQNAFNKLLTLKVKMEYKEEPIPKDLPMIDLIKLTQKNENEKRKIESKYRNQLGDLCGKLLVDKSVAQMKSVGDAKVVQTQNNVANFQGMKNEDKLEQMCEVLCKDDCRICGNNTNIFKTISIPTKLIVALKLCVQEKEISGKKGKPQKITTFDLQAMKTALDANPPRLHYMNLCIDCANTTLRMSRDPTGSDLDISNLFPQNRGLNDAGQMVLLSRLIIMPFIQPDLIKEGNDP